MDIVDVVKFVYTKFGGTVTTPEQSREFWEERWRNAERRKAEAMSQTKPKSPTEEIDLKKAIDDLLNTKDKGAEADQAIIKEKINQPYDEAGFTWLHRAAQEGNKEEAERLLQNGADPRAKSKDGSTPLHEAVRAAGAAKIYASDIVKLLLQKDINGDIINAKNDAGQTPFHFAMCLGPSASDIVEQLMQHDGANLTVEDNDRNTSLHVAASTAVNNMGSLEKLLEKTGLTIIDARNKLGQGALELAIRNNRSKKIINLLVKSGADVNASLGDDTGRHLIHLAATDAQLDTIEELYSSSEKLDIDVRDNRGFTALHRVIEAWSMGNKIIKQNWLEKHSKLVRILKDKAGDIETKDIWRAVALDLLDKKANINTQNHVGNTLLHTILETRSTNNIKPIMQFLLDNGASKKISNHDNNFPLQYGVAWGVPISVMKTLNSQYADTVVTNEHGDTLLHYACSQRDNMEWVKCLLENFNLDPNRKDKLGLSPYLIVKLLLKEMEAEESDRQNLEALSGILKKNQAIIGYMPVDRQLLPLVLRSNYENHRPLGWFKSPVQEVNYSAQNKFDFFSDTSATATDVTDTEGETYGVVSNRRRAINF